jgi:hypothetical protein
VVLAFQLERAGYHCIFEVISNTEPNMGKGKREAIELIERLPDDASLEDIQYHLCVREK